MRTLLIVGLALTLGACNCGPVTVPDAGITPMDSGVYVDGGPSRVAYKITLVSGALNGDGVNVMTAPNRTDTLQTNTCDYNGSSDAGHIIGVDGGTPMIQ